MPEIVFYSIGVDDPIRPDERLPPLPEIPQGALVVIEGRAPIWRYGMAFHRLHGSPAGAVAVYDPKLGVLALNSPGLTQTHALLTGSAALGAGGAIVGVTVDQRGVTRDATPDIGAYEVPTAAAVPTSSSSSSSGGFFGCTMNPNAKFDVGLFGLLAVAVGGLMLRRRRSGARN